MIVEDFNTLLLIIEKLEMTWTSVSGEGGESCQIRLADGLDLLKQNSKTVIIKRSKEKPQITKQNKLQIAQLILRQLWS